MKKENAKDYLPIVQALAEGKTIQIKVSHNNWHDLEDREDIIFDLEPSHYRIKPEPKLIPFDYSDKWTLIGKSVIKKDSNRVCLISALNEMYVYAYETISYKKLFESYTFQDGSPCGKIA